MAPDQTDRWAAGAAYEPFVGRWSRPSRARSSNGSRPTARRVARHRMRDRRRLRRDPAINDPVRVNAFDPSEGFIAYARQQFPTRGRRLAWQTGRSLPLQDATVDAVVSGLMLNFVPHPDIAITEMLRVCGLAEWWRPMSGIIETGCS